MSAKPSRTFRASLETLERRETPSSHLGAAAAVAVQPIHTAAAVKQTPVKHAPVKQTPVKHAPVKHVPVTHTSLLSQGYAVVSQSAPTVLGQQQTITFLGKSKALGGHYTAVVKLFSGLGENPLGKGSGTITTASGDTIDIEVKSRSLIPYFSTNPSGKLEFNILDGTGKFASATGRGAFVGYLNYLNSFRYELRGTVNG